jgi:3-oxoacyl-[acyl-carrier protein] reductase
MAGAMQDRYLQLVNSRAGGLVKRAGLPTPPHLKRYEPGQKVVEGPVLVGGPDGGRMQEPVIELLRSLDGADVRTQATEGAEEPFVALIFDATAVGRSEELRSLYDFFHPVVRGMASMGRVLVLGTPPEECEDHRKRTAQRAIEGFTRSLGKEVKPGSTVNLVYVAEGAEQAAESTLRFFLSTRSAYVAGQVARVRAPVEGETAPQDWERPLAGKVAAVTGSARGIGESIARTFARDGAHVVCMDIPAQGEDLTRVANDVGGEAVQLDITEEDAPQRFAGHVRDRHGGVDVVVHNAGVTQDKTLARMAEDQWDTVLSINLTSQERINDALLADDDGLHRGGRIVSVSSLGGIAGNRGQTNYATSKAGIIGMVQALAPALAARGATINAVAPGFIETAMTAAMPVVQREGGRRMNTMTQGGQPVDVAETIAWMASPGSGGVNGEVVRVCGQSMLGA